VAVVSLEFRNHSPTAVTTGTESLDESGKSLSLQRRAIDQSDHSPVSATVENFPKRDLERAELSSLWSRIDDQIPAAPVHNGSQVLGVPTGNYQHEFAVV